MRSLYRHIISLSLLSLFVVSPTVAQAATITVNSGQSIQAAISAAASGDTLNVQSGNYNETVKITKPLTLVGAGDSTITHGFVISAAGVTLKNFYVTGSTDAGVITTGPNSDIENIHAYNNPNGGVILQLGSDGSKLINNRLEHNAHFGIKVNSNNNLIKGNEIWDTYYSTDIDGMYGFGADNVWDGNYVHDLAYDPATKPHIDCFQTWGNLSGVGISGTTIFQNNRCILPNAASSVDEATSGMTINDGGSGTLIVRNNIFDTYLGIGQFKNGSPSLNIQIYNNTFIGHPNQSPLYSSTAIYMSYMNTIKQFTNNLIVGKNSQQIILINGSAMTGSNNLFYNSAASTSFGGYDASKDLKNLDPLLQANYYLGANSPACSAGGTYIGAFPCSPTTLTTTTSPTPSPSPTPTPKPWSSLLSDYSSWLSHYLQSLTGFTTGDFSGNGLVDGVDYVLWLNHYGK